MKINIYGSTGTIGTKSLDLINRYFPKIVVNLLCANNNVSKLIRQINQYKPKYVYLNNISKYKLLKSKIPTSTKILNYNELKALLKDTKSDFSILAISGYKSLNYFELILKNTNLLGLVNKESIVSAGHLLNNYSKKQREKIYPLDSEHFSLFNFFQNNKSNQVEELILTASGGPFLGNKFSSLSKVTFKEAANHPKWKMGYKNSIDSATLVNKCLELIEAHYLFNIPFDKLNIIIHPESKVHAIIKNKNYLYNMIYFHNDMSIPLFHFINQNFKKNLDNNNYLFNNSETLRFYNVKRTEFPIFSFFKNLDKSNPSNLIRFNIANELAVNLFKKKEIKYTDIYKIIVNITSLNLNYKLNTIKDIVEYHEYLEHKIYEINYKSFL